MKIPDPLILEYNPEHTYSHGYWQCPTCKWAFYSTIMNKRHETGCAESGSNQHHYVIGPRVVEEAQKWAFYKQDDSDFMPSDPICLNNIKQQLPQVLEEEEEASNE